VHWKSNPLATRSKELKGTPLGKTMEQMSRFAARQSYRVHDEVLSNPVSREKFAHHQPALDGDQQEVMAGLDARGYSMVPVADFFDGEPWFSWDELKAEGRRFVEHAEASIAKREAKDKARAEKEKARAEKGKGPSKKPEKGLGKGDYIVRLLGKDVPTLGEDDPWLRLGIADRMLDIVNSYCGMWAKLTYVDLWYTPPAAPGVARVSSQRWHRDYNDERLIKVFLYLVDVEEDTGPLEYVPGSTVERPYGNEWPWRPVSADLYPPQDEFEKRIPQSAVVQFTGPEGSMLFCNTSGFHRGGYATGDRPRVMAVYNYSTPASLSALTLRNFNPEISLDGLSEQAAYALT
jgi:Phytanoyl-CoA dioxygenase (PhyH)